METPPPKELLKKLKELEESQEHLKQEMSRLKVSTSEFTHRSHSVSARRRNIGEGTSARRKSGAASFLKQNRIQDSINLRAGVGGRGGPSAGKFTNKQYLNILQSIAQSVHVFDLNMQIIFWNSISEKVYGYTAEEVVGRNPIDVMVDDRDAPFAMNVAQRCVNGESWTGEFPVKSKSGERIFSVTTCSPFYDDEGSLVGVISITSNKAQYLHPGFSVAKLKAQESGTTAGPSFASRLGLDSKGAVISKLDLDSHQPIQAARASKISDLASRVSNKVRSKMRAGDSSATLSEGVFGSSLSGYRGGASSSGVSIPRGDSIYSPFGVFTCNDPYKDSSAAIPEGLTSKAEHEVSKGRLTHSVWPWVQGEREKDKSYQINPSSDINSESHSSESNKPTNNDASSLWSSYLNANSTRSTSTRRYQ